MASGAFKQVYGESLGALWREYEASIDHAPGSTGRDDGVRQLTKEGFVVTGLRFTSPAGQGRAAELVYSVQTPHAFPTLNPAEVRRLSTEAAHDALPRIRNRGGTPHDLL